VDGTGSGSCLVFGFGISGIEPSGLATTLLVNELNSTLYSCISSNLPVLTGQSFNNCLLTVYTASSN
jgi:hypothetical protein